MSRKKKRNGKLKENEIIVEKVPEYEGCPEVKTKVVFESGVVGKIVELMLSMNNYEWAAYLIGKETKDGYLIEDIYIPEQEVSTASVEIKEVPRGLNIIGHIHSHHSMGAFLSGTDEDHLNYPIHLVVDSKFRFEGVIRKKASCGRIIRKRISNSDIKVNIEETKKIKKRTFRKNGFRRIEEYGIDYSDVYEYEGISMFRCPVCGSYMDKIEGRFYCPNCGFIDDEY